VKNDCASYSSVCFLVAVQDVAYSSTRFNWFQHSAGHQ
jgi:hypothetical protein